MGRCKEGAWTFMNWHIRLTVPAAKQFDAIKDTRIKESISRRINALSQDPNKQGKPMIDELAGYRSVRAVGQRYRIIYKVEDEEVVVLVVALGLRREGAKSDVYELAK